MKFIYFLLICISVSSCSLEPDFAIRSEFKKTEQESNQFESKQVLTINIADGVLESKLRDDAVNLLTEFLNHYDDYYGLMDLFSAESKQYINNPFYSYHLPEFFAKGAFTKYKPTLLSIYVLENDTIAKVSFNRIDSVGNTNLKAIFNFGLTTENSELKLANMVMINSKNWIHRKYGTIAYIFPECHDFSEQNADSMIAFGAKLSETFNVEPFDFRYFITENNIELQRLRGIDYVVDLYSLNTRSGLAEPNNRIIYSGNGSEYYPHEMVHLYIREWIGSSGYNAVFDEGLATYLGGSRGRNLEWHLHVLSNYVKSNDIDFSNVFDWQNQITDSTALQYVFGGLIIKQAYEKGGMESVKELFSAGATNNDFYKAVETVLGVKQEDLNEYIRNELKKYGS